MQWADLRSFSDMGLQYFPSETQILTYRVPRRREQGDEVGGGGGEQGDEVGGGGGGATGV